MQDCHSAIAAPSMSACMLGRAAPGQLIAFYLPNLHAWASSQELDADAGEADAIEDCNGLSAAITGLENRFAL